MRLDICHICDNKAIEVWKRIKINLCGTFVVKVWDRYWQCPKCSEQWWDGDPCGDPIHSAIGIEMTLRDSIVKYFHKEHRE